MFFFLRGPGLLSEAIWGKRTVPKRRGWLSVDVHAQQGGTFNKNKSVCGQFKVRNKLRRRRIGVLVSVRRGM